MFGTDGRELFGEFLRGEFSEENLEFWLACERYRVIDDDEQLASIAQQIYQDFVAPNAPRQVSVSPELNRLLIQFNITPCLKKLCQLIFCSLSVKYEPILIKIGKVVPEEILNKTVPKMPTSPKVCALTFQILQGSASTYFS